MAVYNIVKKEDPILRKQAKEVLEVTPKIVKLIQNMASTMYKEKGIGLAAPQVGFSKRVIVVDIGDEHGLYALVNPIIVEKKGAENGAEEYGEVIRAKKIVIEGLNEKGEPVRIQAEGLLARAFQHEIDHLDGILFIDKATNLRRGE